MKKKKKTKDHQRHRDPKASGAAIAQKGRGNRNARLIGDLNYGKIPTVKIMEAK